ncbi:MAG: DUF5131 family protein [Crenarchaeota archaeon]|nr:DUF5131 family protein [Thermoproteota archaeon]
MRQSRMFNLVTRTWNPVTGCVHFCIYCWARRLAITRLYKLFPEYYDPEFKPRLIEKKLRERFRPGELVFITDVGDLFCSEVPDEWILKVLEVARRNERTLFLLLTKNPGRFIQLLEKYGVEIYSRNMIPGVTVESDYDTYYIRMKVSRAEPPYSRLETFLNFIKKYSNEINGFIPKCWISIEPVIKFRSWKRLVRQILRFIPYVNKVIVYVGYDNYGLLKKHGIEEPTLEEVQELINYLKDSPRVEVHVKTLRRAWNEKLGR